MTDINTTSPETTRYGTIPVTVLLRDDLTDGEIRTYAALAAHADTKGRCFPSIATICSLAGKKHHRTVERNLSALEKKGLIRKEHRTGRSTVYTLIDIAKATEARIAKCGTRADQTPTPGTSVPPPRHQRRANPGTSAGDNSPPNIKKRNNQNIGAMPLGGNTTASWDIKVRGFVPSKPWTWGAFNGPRPDERGCYAPWEILVRYGYRQAPPSASAPVA